MKIPFSDPWIDEEEARAAAKPLHADAPLSIPDEDTATAASEAEAEDAAQGASEPT